MVRQRHLPAGSVLLLEVLVTYGEVPVVLTVLVVVALKFALLVAVVVVAYKIIRKLDQK